MSARESVAARCFRAVYHATKDGKPRDADELLAEALRHCLAPRATTRKYVYSAAR
jgi:hypothetical protein